MEFTAEIVILLVIAGLFAAIFACASRAAAPVFFCLMLFAASISSPVESGFQQSVTWIGPIQIYRSHLFIAASFLLLLNLVVQARRHHPFSVPANVICMIAVGVLMGTLIAAQGDPIQGVITIVAAAVSLGSVALLLSQKFDYRSAMWLFVGAVFGLTCLINLVVSIQFVLNPNVLLSSEWSRRFQGLTGNPQFFGAQLAIILTVCLWMLLNKVRRPVLIVLIPVIAMNSLFLAWTGSRTSFGMFVIGVSIVLFSRFKQAAIAIPIAAGAVAIAVKFLGNLLQDVDTSRLTSLDNTRRGVVTRLLEIYAQNPIIGAGLQDGAVDKSENSLLYSLAAYGTGMGLLYILAVITTGFLTLRMLAVRRWADAKNKSMIDLVLAINAAFFAGTLLEGYFIGRVNVLILFFVSINMIGYQIVRQLSAAKTSAVLLPLETEEQSAGGQPSGSDALQSYRDHDQYGELNYAELAH